MFEGALGTVHCTVQLIMSVILEYRNQLLKHNSKSSVGGKTASLIVSSPIGPIVTNGTSTANPAVENDKNSVCYLIVIQYCSL